MKSNLMLIKFITTPEKGTYEMKETKSFFGSKMMDIEDNLIIDDKSIQYSQRPTDGFQYYDNTVVGVNETVYVTSCNDVKRDNHIVTLLQQTETNLNNNTRWQYNIDIRSILKLYLYSKIKESRTFRAIRTSDLLNQNIDNAVYDYISDNIIDRFKLDSINFYVLYENIATSQTNVSGTKLKFNPSWDFNIRNSNNLVNDINIISDTTNLNPLIFNYNQIKPSTDYRYNYYFDLFYSKI